MVKLRNGSKGMIRTRLSRLRARLSRVRARHSTSELPRSKRIIDRTLREEGRGKHRYKQFSLMPSRGTTGTVWQQHICSEAGDGDTLGNTDGTAHMVFIDLDHTTGREQSS